MLRNPYRVAVCALPMTLLRNVMSRYSEASRLGIGGMLHCVQHDTSMKVRLWYDYGWLITSNASISLSTSASLLKTAVATRTALYSGTTRVWMFHPSRSLVNT